MFKCLNSTSGSWVRCVNVCVRARERDEINKKRCDQKQTLIEKYSTNENVCVLKIESRQSRGRKTVLKCVSCFLCVSE